jgi:hypothetical protein
MQADEMKPRSKGRSRTVVVAIVSIGWGTYDVVEPYGASRPLGVIILVCGAGLAIATLLDVIKERRSTSSGRASK